MKCPLCMRESITFPTAATDHFKVVCTNPDCKNRGIVQLVKVKKEV